MSNKNYVTYEEFGAVGDGTVEDFEAVYNAHVYANEKGLPVKAKPGAKYYLHNNVIDGEVKEEHKQLFLDGLDIGDDDLTMPAKLVILKSGKISEIELTIQEGRFHQVKRMFEAIGTKVTYLKRISMGPLSLGDLQPGEVRVLTETELEQLKNR